MMSGPVPQSPLTEELPKVEKPPKSPVLSRYPGIDLLARFPALKWLLKQRWFQFAAILPNLVLFVFFLVAGIFGSPVGNRNIIIIFVWILWWFVLIGLLVPLLSRVWCTVCPFPFFGEWIQRGALIFPKVGKTVGRNKYFGLNLKWPRKLSNIWLQNIGFLGLCTFSALFLTRPIVSVIVLGSLFVIATVLHLIYRQRAFCMYVCPVSGFLSLYAMTSMTAVRSKDETVCKKCTTKSCIGGNEKGWGCPWFMFPSTMDRNNYCGLCMECLKTCPHDNMTVLARPFASDTKLKGYDEAWKAFIMLALAGAYSLIYQGPWGILKDWANVTETQDWGSFAIYAAALWATALVVIPSFFTVGVVAGRRLIGAPPDAKARKQDFLGYAYTLVPLGLCAWVAFSLPLVFVNGVYILNVASDPLGWGWDLFGTGNLAWSPLLPHWMPYIQVPILIAGLYQALKVGAAYAFQTYPDGKIAVRSFLPVGIFLSLITIFFMVIYVG